MKKRLFAVIALLFIMYSNLHADEILLASDNWCPINCSPGSKNEGFMIDIARHVFASSGHTVKYITIPWARTLKMIRLGHITGAVGAYIDDCPECIYPKNELAMIGFTLYVNKDSNWLYTDISSLNDIVLGVIGDYSYLATFDTYIEKNKNNPAKIQIIYGSHPLKRNIKKLLTNRVQAIIAANLAYQYTSRQMGVQDKIKSAGTVVKPEKAFIAFSPVLKQSTAYAALLSDGVASLRATGELGVILNKYGLTDWR